MSSCENCKALHDKLDRIRAILAEPEEARGRRRRRFTEEVFTPWGRLIAAAATSRGKTLAEISEQLGHGSDYLVRIARGDLTLIRPSASQIGAALGIDLMRYVGSKRGFDASIPKSVPGELPGLQGGEGAAAGASEAAAS